VSKCVCPQLTEVSFDRASLRDFQPQGCMCLISFDSTQIYNQEPNPFCQQRVGIVRGHGLRFMDRVVLRPVLTFQMGLST
jgi:hypothetical protein